ncbi:MAG TPA: glycosyltransferase family 4 protein [Holophagaceae bacterium]|nr:glycosyltransferase family 4 protein [Holophagaceae bacterium]
MRVAVLGGAARDLVNFRGHLLSELAKAGHTVYGLAPGGTDAIRAELAALGATHLEAPIDRTGVNPIRDLANARRLRRLLEGLRLDCLLAYEVKAVAFGLRAAAQAGIPRRYAMITGRGSTLQGDPEGLKDRAVRGAVKALYRGALGRASGVLFQNEDDRAFFEAERLLPPRIPRTIVNGSGVDVDHFGLAPLPDGPTVFLFVGRLLRDKGVEEFVEASRRVASGVAPVRFRILGPLDTNPKAIREDRLAAWTREGVVDYLGEAKDVRPALAAAHVLVLPSYGEGTPRSVLEAMSMGRAILTTDVPGCRAAVQDGRNGLLVPARDPAALAAAMARLAQDRTQLARLGAEGRRVAEARYDVRKVTGDILRFMEIP